MIKNDETYKVCKRCGHIKGWHHAMNKKTKKQTACYGIACTCEEFEE